MNAPDELRQLRQRVDRLANELAATRVAVDSLESRWASLAETDVGSRDARVVELLSSSAPVPRVAPFVELVPPPVEPASATMMQPPPLPAEWAEPAVASASAPAPAPETAEPAADEGPSPLRLWLERLQLWPPQEAGDAEVRLGAWWATRLGALFAVIGVVFFGVYLSVDTPAWVKLLELAVVSLGVVGLGAWLERRLPRFGQVLFGAGQALVFFTAFAAYTVPAVKVLESTAAAVGWQLVAAAAIGLLAWKRRAPVEGTMAVALGFVAAWFSLAGGLHLYALGAALGLALTAVLWRRHLDWAAPSIVALLGYWGVYVSLIAALGFATTPLLPLWVWGFTLAGYALFFWRDDPVGTTVEISAAETRWVQNTNSSAAVLAGWVTAWIGFPEHMGLFYTLAAGVLGVAAARRHALQEHDGVGAVLLAKAAGAVTLAVITWSEGRTVELALLVQAAVMLVINRRLHSTVLGVAAGVVWLVSLGYAVDALSGLPLAWDSMLALAAVVYALGATAWLVAAAWATAASRPGVSLVLHRLAGAVGFGVAAFTAFQILPLQFLPHRLMLAAALLGGLAWAGRSRSLFAGTAGVALLSHGALGLLVGGAESSYVWGAIAVVVAPTILAAAVLGWRADRSEAPSLRLAVTLAWLTSALAVVTFAWALREVVSAPVALSVGAVGAVGLALAAPRWPRRGWMSLAVWFWLVTSLLYLSDGAALEGRWLVGAAVFSFAGAALTQRWSRGRTQVLRESVHRLPQHALVALGFLTSIAAWSNLGGDLGLLTAALLALGAMAGVTWVSVRSLRFAAWALWLMMAIALPIGNYLSEAVAATVATAWVPVFVWGWVRRLQPASWAGPESGDGGTLSVQGWVAGALGLSAVVATQTGSAGLAWMGGAAVGLVLAARWRIPELSNVARVYAAVAWVWAFTRINSGETVQWGAGSGYTVAIALLVAVLPLILPWSVARRRLATTIAAGLGLVLLLVWAAAQAGELVPFVTIIWGAGALVWFGLGMVARSRAHRLWGLFGILCCIPRVFLVDLQSTLHRIAAFAVLGVVLLWVGFSYHRFRHWITDPSASDRTAGSD